MHRALPVREVVDLTDADRNTIFNMTVDDAQARVASGDAVAVRAIDGHFALIGRRGHLVRMARSLSIPMRYFVAKRTDGPALVAAHRIDAIRDWLNRHGLSDQFHPTYTRMVPAHYITEIALVGCPDPIPTYTRYFTPRPEASPPDVDALGGSYIGAAADAIAKWLKRIPDQAPVGVCFSGGIDSGAIFLLTVHVMQQNSLDLGRLKAFTLSVAGGGDDLDQARRFLEANDLSLFHEPIEVPEAWVDYRQTVRILEDYKPLDVQAGSVALALCRGIRERYPDWRFLIDGDGGDENLKDYPIEENPELTIRSVLSNRMLYQEGWGVDSIKHSLVYTGGQSRGCTRSFAPMTALGFSGFSPFTLPDVIEVAEGIPFVELTDWRHDRLYQLKGRIVSRGVEAITGLTMPIFEKRRFQEGALGDRHFAGAFPRSHRAYRNAFQALYDG